MQARTVAPARSRQAPTADASEPLIMARGLVVSREGQRILDHVDVAVHAGEIVTLVGPNGAGKTTLVRVLLGLVPPDGGTVWRRPGLTIGYAPQRLQIDPAMPLAVKRFLTLARPAGEGELLERLAEVGLPACLGRQIVSLSGGEFHRLLLARALLRDPDLLVLDEPLTGVDLAGQAELYRLITRTRDRRGCGILLVSHDLHLVLAATDRVICLEGRVCCAGTPVDVAHDPDFQRLFGTDFADAFAPYRHHHEEGCPPPSGGRR